jgi:hypothetical protein
MTLEPTDQFDVIVAEGLRGRAAHATVHGRGMGDVRRRLRRRRQRHMAVGLMPAMAGLGWAVTRPVADTPLTPSGDAGPCGQTSSFQTTTTWDGMVTDTTITFDANGNPIGTTTTNVEPVVTDGNGNYLDKNGTWVTIPFVTDANGYPATSIAPPPWTGGPTTAPMLDSDGNPVMVDTTLVTEASTTTTAPAEATTTTICEPGTLPATSDVPVTTEFGDSTTTSIVVGDLTSTKVQVANCSAQNGVARMMSSALADVGFALVEATNGTCDPTLDSSYVIYDEGVPGAADVAHTLGGTLGGLAAEPGTLPLNTESATWADGSGVVLYLGNDLAGKVLSEI